MPCQMEHSTEQRSGRSKIYVLLAIASLALLVKPATSQVQILDCPGPRLDAAEGEYGYGRRGDVCEGLYRQKLSSKLEIVSARTGDSGWADWGDPVQLERPAISATGLQPTEIFATARAIRPRTYYQMNTELRADRAAVWDLGGVVKKLGIESQLGILGWFDHEGQRFYVPLCIGHDCGDSVHVLIRPDMDVERVRWRVVEPTIGKYQRNRSYHSAGSPISLKLKSPPPGKMRIEVEAKHAVEEEWSKDTFDLVVPEKR